MMEPAINMSGKYNKTQSTRWLYMYIRKHSNRMRIARVSDSGGLPSPQRQIPLDADHTPIRGGTYGGTPWMEIPSNPGDRLPL